MKNTATILLAAFAQAQAATVPADLDTKRFSGPEKTPSPAVICAAPTGEVYVGVDMQGSLGKKPNLGKIVRLVDTDNDGTADKATTYATIDNPRGLIAIGNQLIVLHCTLKNGKPHNQRLSVYTDANNDGVADGPPKPLLKSIGNPKFVQSRGADHCTNNIRLGIDGWIYISVGDFGFIGAEGSDGKKLDFHGGGIVRVRPDGSEIETFIHGTRNVYDVAIDPFMNVFTRENTNDGVGWWIRFSHYIQSGEYGYPSLYTNFPGDMLPALNEYGGGSGTGSLFLQEPGWPEKYNNKPLLADWGRSKIYIHEVTPQGASFNDKEITFIGSSQVADLDVDGSGRMYIAAWAGAGYRGNAKKGHVDIVTPKNWKYIPFPDLPSLTPQKVVTLLKSQSITARTYASQEILRRKNTDIGSSLITLAKDTSALLESRVAAIYTLAQLKKEAALPELEALTKDAKLREHAIRAMADRLSVAKKADLSVLKKALNDTNPRVQVAAAIALGRTGQAKAAEALIAHAAPPRIKEEPKLKKKIFKSKPTSKVGQRVSIKADISGYKQLTLTVDPLGSSGQDHAAWINPTVITADGKKIDLTTIKWKSAKQGWGKTLVNKDCTNKPLDFKGIGTHAAAAIVYDIPSNAKWFTAEGTMTKGSSNKGKVAFVISESSSISSGESKPHSTPKPEGILPHVARQALVALKAYDQVIAGLNSKDEKNNAGALSTMKFMHNDKVVKALIDKAGSSQGVFKQRIVETLIRLHQKEESYDGSTWWGTRPNPHGPYYYPVDWSSTSTISSFLEKHLATLSSEDKTRVVTEIKRNKAYVESVNPRPGKRVKKVKKIGKTSIEDVVLYLQKAKGNGKKGSKVITTVGCAGCHNINRKDVIKGPDLTALGNMKKDDIVQAIIKPAATIAKSWVTIITKDGKTHTGTVVKESDKEIVVHNIAGVSTTIPSSQVKSRGPGMNMMGPHLCDNLTLQEFADLIEYIQALDKNRKK